MANTEVCFTPGRVENAYDEIVTTSNHIYDDDLNDFQENINKRVKDRLDELVWIED